MDLFKVFNDKNIIWTDERRKVHYFKADSEELDVSTLLQRFVQFTIKDKLGGKKLKSEDLRSLLRSDDISLKHATSSIVFSTFGKSHEETHYFERVQYNPPQWRYQGSISDVPELFAILTDSASRKITERGYSMGYCTQSSPEDVSTITNVFYEASSGGSTKTRTAVFQLYLYEDKERMSNQIFTYRAVEYNFCDFAVYRRMCLSSLPISPQISIVEKHIKSLFHRNKQSLYKFTKSMTDNQQFLLHILEIGIRTRSLWMFQLFFRFLKKGTPEVGHFLLQCKSSEDSDIGKVVKEGIENSFVRIFSKKLRVLDVYCAQSAKNNMQNSQWPDVLVVVTKGIKETPLKHFCGFDVVFRDLDHYKFTDESKKVLQHEALHEWRNSKPLNLPLDNVYTQYLMRKHRNITLISSSRVRSKNFESKHEMQNKDCIVIYCWVKGYIPVGEEAFPKKIKNIDVDVREGASYFAADENSLQIGSKIGRQNCASLGTLGGFVNIDSSTIGCLTSAHVVCPHDALQSEDIARFISNNLIEVENKSDSNIIGSVERAVFKHSNSREISVDAALVKISRQHPENGNFSHEISETELSNAGFSAYNRPAFTNGAVIEIGSTNYRRPLLKYGASSGLTVGYAHCIKVHAAIINNQKIIFETGPQKMEFQFHGQLEVLPVHGPQDDNEAANIKFATNGDSGSLVFMIVKDMPPILKCVGMVTAVTSYGSCLITPIHHVLLDLGLPLNAFCKFENENQSRSEDEINETDVQRIVREVTQAISTNFDSKFQTINSRLNALEERN